MHVIIKKILKTSALFIAAVFLFQIFSTTTTYAATRTWTGTTSGSWSVGTNWSGGVAPVTGDDLVFPSGASNLSNTNDLTENTIINSITLSGSGYTLSGNPLILGAGLAGLTDSVASGGNTIALDIRLDVTRDIVVTNTAETLTISGRIAGVGGINKEGTGKLVLSGANTFGGTLKINVGIVNAQNDDALGTIAGGTEVVGGAALELQGTIDISYEPLTLRGYGVSNNGALRNISNNNTFRGLITLTSAGGTEIQSDSGTLTLTGGITGTFPLVFDGAGNTTFTTAPIAISTGTLTKNGAGTLRFNFPNTYTGLTTVNAGTLLYGVDNALLSGAITVTAGTLDIATFSDMVGTVTLGTTDLASGTITGTTGMLSSATWTLNAGTISAIIAGDGGAVTKNTLGTVTFTRPNQYTGATSITAGILKIQDSAALGTIDGTTTITAGATLQIDGSDLSIPEYITFAGSGLLYAGAIRNSTGNNTITGLLTLSALGLIKSDTGTTLTIDTKGLAITTQALHIAGAGNVTFTSTAPIYGTTGTLTKSDAGVLTIQSICNFTGATIIHRGTLILSGAGGLPSSAVTVNSGGTFTVDNSISTALSRLGDATALTMNGGSFNFIGNSSSAVAESTGALTLSSGHNIITVTPGAGGSTTMTFASLSRTAGATVLFRGTSFGSNPGANVSTVMFTSAPAVLGGGGAANSTTISIIKGAFGDDSLSGTGTDMVAYNIGNTNGLRLLNGAGFSGEYSSTLTTNTNVRLTADTVASTVSINSLILDGFSITNPGSAATITLSSGSLAGNILMNSATSIAGANTTLGITTNHLDILTTASATISAIIGTAVAGSVAISGTGSVTLSAAGAYTGTTFVNNATLTYGASNVISSGGITVNGGVLAMGTASDTVGAVTLQNGSITSSSGTLTGTSYSFREGTVSAILAGSGAITVVATNAAPNSVVTLSGNNTSSGTITVTSGILKLGAAGDGTNTPLGVVGGATTIANTGALDLNGFTLSTAEPITINGLGYGAANTVALGNSNSGSIMNTGAAASYSGAITLGAAARIAADYSTLTISSTVSGAALGLTLGGFSDMTFSGAIGTTTGTLTKDGIGTLTLSGNSSYSGTTTISSGTVKIGAAGDATNSPLGVVGGITSVAAGARLDLNGTTLSTAEPITLNGVGYGIGNGASGALINSSGSTVTYSGLITLGSASTIKADSGTINLTAAGTISGSGFGLTLGGAGIGTLSSIIGTVAGTVTKIDTGTWTLSGASTFTGAASINLGTLKIGATGATTNTPLGVVAGATSVMSGAVLDLNGFTLSAAEPLTINGRGINDGGALVGGAVTWPGTIAQATDSRITSSSGTLTISGAVSGAFALYIGGAGNITTSAVFPAVALSIVKQGAGTLTVTGANLYTGETRVDAGTFAYASGGTTTLVATNLTVKGGTFNNSNNVDTIGTVTLVGGTITNSSALTGTAYTLEGGTISGIIAGAVAVTKNTNNTVTLSGVNTISSTITINAGTLTISGSGSDTAVTGVTVNLGGTLTLDNSTTAVADRLNGTGGTNAIVITMNGGNLNFLGNSAAAASETLGQLALASGHNVVTVTPGAGGSTTLTFATNPGLNRTAGATVLFRGTSFGSTPAANVSTLMFTTTPTLTGGGGAASSTTISVIKGAFGDSSLSGTGSDMVTYNVGNTNGLRLLNGAGFSGEYATNLATTNSNVKLTADAAASTVTINSIILNNFNITNPGSAQTITLSTTGNILANSATSIAGANTTLGISTSELDVLATSTSTISAIIGTATTGSLVVSGSGSVTLSNTSNAYTGTTFINNATLTYGASNVISSGGVTIVGGTMNLNGNSDTVGSISINAGTIATGAGTLTGNGTFTTIANNNVASKITGNLGLGANATFNIGDGLMDNDAVISAVMSGAFTVTKSTGAGVLELSGSNTYTGLTTISAGTIRLGAAGGATNTPLGTTAAGTTVGSGFSLDLNGYTLGTAEALTISGTGIGGLGALLNTSSTAVTYSGLITLGAAATVTSNYGDINITNAGTITGATFGLTIGGAGNGSLASILGTTSGTLTKNGLGMWVVSGSSTYTGLTTISAGTLKLGAAGDATNTPLGTNAGGVTISATGIFDLNGFTLGTAEPIGSLNGTGIAGIGAFINSSNNTISYSGAITLAAASRVANHGSGVLTLSGAIAGNFALTFVTVGGITQSSASVWSGTGTLIKEGSGTLILAGQNTMTGAMTVSTGKLQLGASGGATNTPLGTNAGGVTVASGAALDFSTFSLGGASTYETLNISGSGISNTGALMFAASTNNNFGAMTVAANARIVNSGSGTAIFGGTITAANGINLGIGGTGPTTISGVFGATATSATLTKWDSGTLAINAASITTGLVRINGGTLAYGVNDALSTPAVTVAGGTLSLGAFNETNIGTVTLINGSITGSGTITSTVTYAVENGTISAVLGSAVAAGIAKNTGGRVTLSGNNTFTSTSIAINAGYLNIQNSNALGASGTTLTTTISNGATLELQNNITLPSTKLITANGIGMAKTGAIRNVADTNTIGANVTLGSTNVRINSDSGALTIPSISGNTFSVFFGGASNIAVTGAIGTTSGTVSKNGSGTLTLTGTNTYTGSTTIFEGTLSANTSAALGNESATNTLILAGGTLQAAGTITSAATRAFSLASNSSVIDTNGNSISVAGTFGGSGSFTKTGSGTLTVTGVTTLAGDLTVSGGTFAPTNVTISGTATQSIDGFNPTGTITMSKTAGTATFTGNVSGAALTINGSGGTLNLGSGLTHTFTGDITLTAGTLNGGSSTLNVNSSTTTAWNGAGSVFSAGTGTVVFGGNNQTLAASATTFNNVSFTGAGFTKTFSSTTTINGDFTTVGGGGGTTYATWSDTDKGAGMVLTNGQLTATANNPSTSIRGTIGVSTGKWYWETTVQTSNVQGTGIANGSATLTNWPGSDANAWTFWTDDGIIYNNSSPIGGGGGFIGSPGDVIGIELDCDAHTVSFYKNNSLVGTVSSLPAATYYPYWGRYDTLVEANTANFGATTLTYTGHTGFNQGLYTGSSPVTLATAGQTLVFNGDILVTGGTSVNLGSSPVTIGGTKSTQTLEGITTTGTVTMTKTAGTATMADNLTANALTINGVGGTLNLGNIATTPTITGAITLTNGTLAAGSAATITAGSFSSSNSNTRALNLGSATWALTGTGTVWDMTTSTGATITPGSSTIKLTDSSASGKTFAGGGKTYNNIWFAPGAGTGSFTISGDNTFNDIKDNGSAAHSVLFTAGSTQHLSSWNINGTSGNLITINSTTTGTHTLIKDNGGDVSADYLNIQHSIATLGVWLAGLNSVNNQNVASAGSGWLFSTLTLYRGGGGGAAGGESSNGGGGSTGGGGSGGGTPTTATGTAVLTSNAVTSINVTYGGSGYTSAPLVSICGGGGSGATATAVLTADAVTSVNVNTGGSGYSSVPTVIFGAACPVGGGGSGGGGDSG